MADIKPLYVLAATHDRVRMEAAKQKITMSAVAEAALKLYLPPAKKERAR